MTHSKFEKYASSKITQHQSSVDADALWDTIGPQVPKRKRRGVFWPMLFGCLAIGAISIALWNSTTSGEQHATGVDDVERTEALKSSSEKVNADAPSTTKAIKEVNSKPVANEPVPKNKSEALEDILKTDQPTEKKNKVRKDLPADSKLMLTESRTKDDGQQPESNQNTSEIITDSDNMDEVIYLTDNQSRSIEPVERIGFSQIAINALQEDREFNIFPSIAPISVDQSQLPSNPYPGSKHKTLFSISVYGGVSGTSSLLSAKNNNSAEYLQVRNDTEKQLETIQFGIEIGADIYKGLTIKSGVEVSRIARVFTFNDEIMVVDSVYGLKEIFVNNQTMDTINVYGQIPVVTTTAYQKTTYNNISQIDIPVKIGYAFRSEKWRFGLDVGTLINLSTRYTGEIFSPDATFYSLEADAENWFKTNTDLALTAGLNIGYTFGTGYEFYLAPFYRSATVFSTDVNPIEQSHARLGINLGIRYVF